MRATGVYIQQRLLCLWLWDRNSLFPAYSFPQTLSFWAHCLVGADGDRKRLPSVPSPDLSPDLTQLAAVTAQSSLMREPPTEVEAGFVLGRKKGSTLSLTQPREHPHAQNAPLICRKSNSSIERPRGQGQSYW